MTTYGVLGVGSLGHAVVTGLLRDVADPPPVVLSPRGADRARELARAFPSVSVAPDNQAVVDAADVVVVCLRAADSSLLADLDWRSDPVVVSAVAGLAPQDLGGAVAPEGADFEAMVAAHAPAGGGNEQLATLMRERGVFEATRRSLEEVYRRQTGRA